MSNNENQQDTVYSTRTLSKWFAIGSILLLLVTLWAGIQDYARPWKVYQRQAQKVSTAISERKLLEANLAMLQVEAKKIKGEIGDLDKELEDLRDPGIKAQKLAEKKALEEQAAKVENVISGSEIGDKEVNTYASSIVELDSEIEELGMKVSQVVVEIDEKLASLEAKLYAATMKYQTAKGIHDENHYWLEYAIKKKSPDVDKKLKAYKAEAAEVEALFKDLENATAARDQGLEDKKDILSKISSLEDKKASLERQRNTLKKAIQNTELNIVNVVRNAPVVDFIAPTIKVHQVILNGLYDEYFFNKVPRVDRCMTCHVNANKAGYEDFPQPFTTHSKLHLVSGPESPHPVETFGCTVCHAGVPQSVDFTNAAHTPGSFEQAAEWDAKYGFHKNHHIKTHMIPLKMTEGKCIQCHAQEVVLDEAPTLNAGMRIIERAGCYGCHKFEGHFDELYSEKKAGPSLERVASKVDSNWMKKWLWNPKAYRPSTLMPMFWQTHNNSDPASLERGKVEVDAIAHYIMKQSKEYEPLQLASTVVGDVSKGKTLVKEVGCLGCHAIDDMPVERPTDPKELGYKDPRVPMFGPELNQLGSKVTDEWLRSWLKQPKHYWAGTSMPSMKLSDQEVADISAYLLTKKNLDFEVAEVPQADPEVRDGVVLEFLEGQMHSETAKVQLASMSLEDKKDFLGEKMISAYGCYACHAIQGFEDAPRIGAELTVEGSKEVTKFAFDNVEIDHTSREEWIYTKIRTPRIWDVGKKRDFAAKARMPHFGLTHEQATAVTAVVIGYEAPNVAKARMAPVDGRKEDIIAGQRVVNRYNCIGCHALQKEGSEYGGEVLAYYDDNAEGPPLLYDQGHKTQSDWLFSYLKNTDVMIRPWVQIRMPNFQMTDEEARAITKYFAAYDSAPYPFNSSHAKPLSAAHLKEAEGLVNELGCMTCHGIRKPDEPVADAAPHFENVKARLNGYWITKWLENPNAIMPGTRMPALWPANDPDDPSKGYMGIPGYFDDDAMKQMEAVRDYLYQYGGKPTLPPAPMATPASSLQGR